MIICITISIVAFLIVNISFYVAQKDHIHKNTISFREAMDLVELPVITFYNNNRKLNFLLDTGSNISYINESLVSSLSYSKSDKTMSTMGIEANKVDAFFCIMDVTYKDKVFREEFAIRDLSAAFDTVKAESGVQIHGILGSLFFQKYKYILDFERLVAYTKA